MEHKSSLPYSQEPTTCPYPESDQSSPYPHPTSWISILILSSYISRGLFLSGLPTKTLYAPLLSTVRATCPVHLVLLDLITRILFGEGCRSRSFLLCSLPARQSGCVVKLTSRLRLLSRLRMSGVIPLLPIYAYMARTGTTLSFFNSYSTKWYLTLIDKCKLILPYDNYLTLMSGNMVRLAQSV
jgi:hypothetical protein